MIVTEFGIVTDDRLLQLAKALSLMKVTELGITTDESPLQPQNAPYPIPVTAYEAPLYIMLSGIVNAPIGWFGFS